MGGEILVMTEATTRGRGIEYVIPRIPHWKTPDGQLFGDIYNATS